MFYFVKIKQITDCNQAEGQNFKEEEEFMKRNNNKAISN